MAKKKSGKLFAKRAKAKPLCSQEPGTPCMDVSTLIQEENKVSVRKIGRRRIPVAYAA
jgi:hypothetical protein